MPRVRVERKVTLEITLGDYGRETIDIARRIAREYPQVPVIDDPELNVRLVDEVEDTTRLDTVPSGEREIEIGNRKFLVSWAYVAGQYSALRIIRDDGKDVTSHRIYRNAIDVFMLQWGSPV